MRRPLTIFLVLHWAVVFALLAYMCVAGDHGVQVALTTLGVDGADIDVAGKLVAAPLATAFLVVALLFCWAFIEGFLDDSDRKERFGGVAKMAFVAGAAVFSLIFVAGEAWGIDDASFAVAVHLAALMACYLAILGEGWARTLAGTGKRDEVLAAARYMALGAAHTSLLARISGRPVAGKGR